MVAQKTLVALAEQARRENIISCVFYEQYKMRLIRCMFQCSNLAKRLWALDELNQASRDVLVCGDINLLSRCKMLGT